MSEIESAVDFAETMVQCDKLAHAIPAIEQRDAAIRRESEKRIVQLEQERDEAIAERKRVSKLLCDLTIGGSEFVENPDGCAEWIRNRMSSDFKSAINGHGRANRASSRVKELEAQVAELRAALEIVRASHYEGQHRLYDGKTSCENEECGDFWPCPKSLELDAILARTPADALARQQAEALVVEAAWRVRADMGGDEAKECEYEGRTYISPAGATISGASLLALQKALDALAPLDGGAGDE